jgi:hypothetical protein
MKRRQASKADFRFRATHTKKVSLALQLARQDGFGRKGNWPIKSKTFFINV